MDIVCLRNISINTLHKGDYYYYYYYYYYYSFPCQCEVHQVVRMTFKFKVELLCSTPNRIPNPRFINFITNNCLKLYFLIHVYCVTDSSTLHTCTVLPTVPPYTRVPCYRQFHLTHVYFCYRQFHLIHVHCVTDSSTLYTCTVLPTVPPNHVPS